MTAFQARLAAFIASLDRRLIRRTLIAAPRRRRMRARIGPWS